MHVRLTFEGGILLYLPPVALLQLPLDILVATVEVLLPLYLVKAEDEVEAKLLVDVGDTSRFTTHSLHAEEEVEVELIADVSDASRFTPRSLHVWIRGCDPSPRRLLYGEPFLRPRVYVGSARAREESVGGGELSPRTRLVTLIASLDNCLLSMDPSAEGPSDGMVDLMWPPLLPKLSFHFDGFLAMVGVGGTTPLGSDGLGRTGSISHAPSEDLEVPLVSLAKASARVSRARST